MLEPEKQPETQEEKSSHKDMLLRAVAIIGLIAIIVLGAWGIIELTFNLPSFLGGVGSNLSSLFSHPEQQGPEAVTVTLPQYVYTGEPFTVSWVHENASAQNYSYTLSYSCAQGLSIQTPTPTGKLVTVPCNTPFNYTDATANLPLTPSVTGPSQISTTITVSALSLADGSVTASGSSTVVVLPARNVRPGATTTPQQKTPVVQTHPSTGTQYSNPAGIADLSTTILSIRPSGYGLVAVQFAIQNNGTKAVPYGWTFSANVPVGYPYTYYSRPQRTLYPGDKIVYTLTFSISQYPSYQYGVNTITIVADPENRVIESNKTNNTVSAPLPPTLY